MRDLYGSNKGELKPTSKSRILQGLSLLKRDKIWLATEQDLANLAGEFNVHLQLLKNSILVPTGYNDQNKPVLTINNIGNYHWTTRIKIGYSPGQDAEKYAGWTCETASLSKNEVKKVLLSYTDGVVAFFGRTHLAKAQHLIARCDNKQDSVKDIMDDWQAYMSHQVHNPKSSFLKRFEYMDARFRNFNKEDFTKRDVERLFENYLSRFWQNHEKTAQEIIRLCRNGFKTIDDVVDYIEDYVQKYGVKNFNQNSSFMQCVVAIREMKQHFDQTQVQAPSV
jgi:ribosomal protein S17E